MTTDKLSWEITSRGHHRMVLGGWLVVDVVPQADGRYCSCIDGFYFNNHLYSLDLAKRSAMQAAYGLLSGAIHDLDLIDLPEMGIVESDDE